MQVLVFDYAKNKVMTHIIANEDELFDELGYGQGDINFMEINQATEINISLTGDIHRDTADELGVGREMAKSINFGLLYGNAHER